MVLRGTGKGVCRVELLPREVDNGVVVSHQLKSKAKHSGWDAVQVFGTRQWNKRLVVSFNGNCLAQDVIRKTLTW